MNIAKIIGSNSHIDYVARVIDRHDVATPPLPEDHCFGQFVGIAGGNGTAVGVIYDSKLLDPDYGAFGPRLSSEQALVRFSPDYLNERGILVGILLLGSLGPDGRPVHGVPRRVVPPGQEVEKLDDEAVRSFHTDERGGMHLHYYAQVVAHAGPYAVPLLELIIDQLCSGCSDGDRLRLDVLRRSLRWQAAMGGMKL